MENEDEEAVSHSPISDLLSNKTPTILTATSLWLGLGFPFTCSPQTVKPISAAIKVSESQGLQIPHSNQFSGRPSLFLQASDENLFRRIHALQLQPFARHEEDKSLPWRGQLGQVYAFSARRWYWGFRSWVFENWVQAVEEFHEGFGRVLGIRLDSAVRNCVEVVELFVKTATVTREVSRIADWTGWKEQLKLGEIDGHCSNVAEVNV